jgi:hypothetical protein
MLLNFSELALQQALVASTALHSSHVMSPCNEELNLNLVLTGKVEASFSPSNMSQSDVKTRFHEASIRFTKVCCVMRRLRDCNVILERRACVLER